MTDMDLTLSTKGPVLEFPEDTWRDDEQEIIKWRAAIWEAVSYQNPWALLGMRPDGDVWVFGCTDTGIWEAARWSTRVRLLFDEGQRWDDDMNDEVDAYLRQAGRDGHG